MTQGNAFIAVCGIQTSLEVKQAIADLRRNIRLAIGPKIPLAMELPEAIIIRRGYSPWV